MHFPTLGQDFVLLPRNTPSTDWAVRLYSTPTRAFFGNRTFHQQHHGHEHEHHRGQQPKDIETGQRGWLLPAHQVTAGLSPP